MTHLQKATRNFQVVYLWVATYNQIHQLEKIDLVDELSVLSSEDVLYEEERQQQLELKMEQLLTEPDDDGFSFLDKSILRKDLSIPEWYGDYDLTREELEQGKIVRYIPGIGWFVDE